MASTSADKRRRLFAAALLALLSISLTLLSQRALAADAGGTSVGSGSSASGGSSASSGGTSSGSTGTRKESSGSSKGSSGKSGAAAKKGAKPSRTRNPLHVLSVRISRVSCTPSSHCDANPRHVSQRGTLLVSGVGLKPGMFVAFPKAPGAAPSARISSYTPAARLRRTSAGLVVTVPSKAHSGDIIVALGGGRYTSAYGPITVYAHALHPAVPTPPPPPTPAPATATPAGAFEGQGMWIWYVSKSDSGNTASIIAQAHAAGVTTLYIKSSDGAQNYWSQFSPQLVAELHAAGLKVCAWQYVYGSEPVGEAQLGAEAVANGADCLVIDAESEYERRYAAAQTYIDELRAKIGASYPVALTSFPYIFYHLKFPYSVFLAPNGAQFNLPQMYWKDIGNSVDTVYANTFIDNRVYGRPIFPLGQTYGGVSGEELLRFREEAVDYASTGLSFWDWQETSSTGWEALAAPLAPLTSVTPNPGWMELSSGAKGDPVLWMQEHLAAAEPGQETTGIFSAQTTTNLETFQAAHGIPASGIVEAATWQALLAIAPVPVSWTGGGPAGG